MTVYVVQKQMRLDHETRELVPRFPSIYKAERWGELKYVLSSSAHPFETDRVIGSMHESLLDFNDNDHLLLVGNPVLIGMATSVAAHYNNGNVKFLQWSGRHADYSEIVAEIF